MKRRERRSPAEGEFEDPLSNYDPPVYEDDLERSLCDNTIEEVVDHKPSLSVKADQTVREVVKMMAAHNGASVVVVDENERPIGIFSERDVMNRVAMKFDELAEHPVKEVMTPDPVTVHLHDNPARVLNLMTSGGFRHVPVVDADDKLVGIIGTRRLTAYLQKHFSDTASA
jgi:CBS domain-containing protein